MSRVLRSVRLALQPLATVFRGALWCFVSFAGTQVHASAFEAAETIRALQGSFSQSDLDRLSRISSDMAMNADTAAAFWPRYRRYLHQQIALRDQQLNELVRYADLYNRNLLDDRNAAALLERSMILEREKHAARQQFILGLDGILSGLQKLRLYQMELLLDARLRAGLLEQIPLAP